MIEGTSALSVLSDKTILQAYHEKFIASLNHSDQLVGWQYILMRSNEYLDTKFNGRLVIEFQSGRINSVHNQELIAGGTQFLTYIEQLG